MIHRLQRHEASHAIRERRCDLRRRASRFPSETRQMNGLGGVEWDA